MANEYTIDKIGSEYNVQVLDDVVIITTIAQQGPAGGQGPPGPPIADDNKQKVSSADTTSGYTEDKILAGSNITIVKNNTGANETLTLSSPAGLTQTQVENIAIEMVIGLGR